MKTNTILLLFTVVFLSSCDLSKEIDYKTFYDGDKIIVHGFISPQNGAKVFIKKSVAPNNVQADNKVENAIVTLFENETAIRLKKIDDYCYVSEPDFLMKPNKQYSIQVEAENFEKVYSTKQNSFACVPIDTMKLLVEEGTYYKNLVVWFNNYNQLDKAFYLKVYRYPDDENDNVSAGSELFNPYGLVDNVVTGKNSIEYKLGYEKFDSLRVELYTLSPDLKIFLKSFQDYDASKEDPFFEQTYPIYSNIKNGYGIFSVYNYDFKTIKYNKL